jgi:hypothetical protein
MRLAVLSSAAATGFCCATLAIAQTPQRAEAFNPIGTVCGIGGLISGVIGKACNVGGKVLGGGKKVLGGAGAGGGSTAQAVVGLAAIGAWVLVGAKVALHETASIIAHTTAPHLTTTWFSSTYWRMAAIGAMLTMPFLFAAAIQALLRSDLSLLMRAAFGYLPLALLAVGIAAPVTMLLLAATDEMCAVVSSAAGGAGVHFLSHAGVIAGGLSIFAASPFLAFLAGLVAAFGALVLWLELLMRDASVYVVVLMLPLAFAAFVWPARRIWAIRAVELLVALILSKFAIVAVLTLGGAALGQSGSGGVTSMLAGGVLVLLGAFAPWALVRLLPLSELASGAAGALRGESWRAGRALSLASGAAEGASAALTASSRPVDDGAAIEDEPQDAARAQTERLAELRTVPAPVGAAATGSGPPGSDAAGAPTRAEAGVETMDPPGADQTPAQRSPGLGPEFQMDDFTWRLHLGPENGWPPPTLGPIDEAQEPDGPAEPGDPLPPGPAPPNGHL